MRELLLCTQSQALMRHWMEAVDDAYQIVSDGADFYTALNSERNQIVLFDLQSFESIFQEVIQESLLREAKLFALTGTPSFKEGSQLLPAQISGYGNSYMSKKNLQVALDVIDAGQVWLYPEFIQSLIQQASQPQKVQNSKPRLADLTPKELEVAQEIAQGKSNKEAATALEITERTVKAHLTHIYEKLNISDRLTLALICKE